MKKIFSSFSLKSLKLHLKEILHRFPVGIIVIFVISVLFIINIHIDLQQVTEENIFKTIFTLIITFFLSLGIYISSESYNLTGKNKNLLQIFPIGFGILFFIGFSSDLNNFENFIFFILTLSGIISFLFFAPYLKNINKNNIKQSVYYTYFYKVSVVFLISTILGGILFTLGTIAISAIFELFDISWMYNDEIIADWAVFALSFFTPLFALTQIPEKKSFQNNYFNENAFFSFLIKYIAVPFIYIYFFILYAYSIKVLSNFGDWPKGEVSWMVIGFSSFGYITYIFSYIFEEKNKFIKTFRKAFPYVVIPQLGMLSYAIFLRINQYDLTVNRYFVVVFGLWLLIISLYYIFSKRKSLSIITVILTLFTIIISIGPWSVYKLPETRQLNKLNNNLIQAGILKNGKITPLDNYNDINNELSTNIYSGINYICDFDNCSEIKKLFNVQYQELYKDKKKQWEENQEKKLDILNKNSSTNKEDISSLENEIYEGPSDWQITSYITETIKVESFYGGETNEERLLLNFHILGDIFPISTKGYSEILTIESYPDNTSNSKYATINFDDKVIEIVENKVVKEEIDISYIFSELLKLNNNNGNNDLTKEQLTFEKEAEYKILFKRINIKNPDYKGSENVFYLYPNGYILLK